MEFTTVSVRGTIIQFHRVHKQWIWLERGLEHKSINQIEKEKRTTNSHIIDLFIDRDPKLFNYILDYVYNGIFPFVDSYEKMIRITQELDYFGLEYSKKIWLKYVSEYSIKEIIPAKRIFKDKKWTFGYCRVTCILTGEVHIPPSDYTIDIVNNDKWVISKNTNASLCKIGTTDPIYTFRKEYYSGDCENVVDFNENYILTNARVIDMRTNTSKPNEYFSECHFAALKEEQGILNIIGIQTESLIFKSVDINLYFFSDMKKSKTDCSY